MKKITLCLQDGIRVKVVGNNIELNIDTDKTQTDLWLSQITYYLENNIKIIDSGNIRLEKNDKLKLIRNK